MNNSRKKIIPGCLLRNFLIDCELPGIKKISIFHDYEVEILDNKQIKIDVRSLHCKDVHRWADRMINKYQDEIITINNFADDNPYTSNLVEVFFRSEPNKRWANTGFVFNSEESSRPDCGYAFSMCSTRDKFVLEIGVALAIARYFGEDIPPVIKR